jgi:hypothetical protein
MRPAHHFARKLQFSRSSHRAFDDACRFNSAYLEHGATGRKKDISLVLKALRALERRLRRREKAGESLGDVVKITGDRRELYHSDARAVFAELGPAAEGAADALDRLAEALRTKLKSVARERYDGWTDEVADGTFERGLDPVSLIWHITTGPGGEDQASGGR